MTVDPRELVRQAVRDAIRTCLAEGRLPGPVEVPAFQVEVPREEAHGDYACNAALLLGRSLRRPPREVAEAILASLRPGPMVAHVEVAGPGFLNFYLSDVWAATALSALLKEGPAYGRGARRGERVLVEFVSANPTGPLNVVSARAAAFGDALAAVLDFAGYDVEREYYVNDAGEQLRKLALSLEARLRQARGEEAPIPEGGYPGEYLIEVAEAWRRERGLAVLDAPEEERVRELGRFAAERILAGQRRDLEEYGVHFDRFVHESHLHESGQVTARIRAFQEQGLTYEADGALWLRATAFGAEKDEVLVRGTGLPTYFAADAAYHADKYARGYDRLIDVLGPDHHGHIARLKALVAALGRDPASLECIVVQQVRLLRGGQAVKMSKRGGAFVTMRELVEEVGRDAARFFFLQRAASSHLDFDLDLARLQGQENPVYYVQYAHARIMSILRNADPLPGPTDLTRLVEREEFALIKALAEFPHEVQLAASLREPHRLTHYAHQVASAFHTFYNQHRVLTPDPELTKARLALCRGVALVLENALGLLGVSAPERM